MNTTSTLLNRLHNPDLGIFLLRLALGVVFLNAGWLKFTNIDMTIGFFAKIGFPASLAYLVTYVELLGGLAFILGILVRYFGFALAINMLVATKLLFSHGFSLANGGYEYTFVLMLGSLALITLGAGKYSLAHFFKKK